MLEFDDIYTDLIMEHSMNSYNKRNIDNPTCSMKGHNPNCGDEIELEVILDNDTIQDMSFVGHGCAISQSSTSIMIDTLKGKTTKEALSIIETFLKMIRREPLSTEEKESLKDSVAFENISNMPARVKCAELAWRTLNDILKGKDNV